MLCQAIALRECQGNQFILPTTNVLDSFPDNGHYATVHSSPTKLFATVGVLTIASCLLLPASPAAAQTEPTPELASADIYPPSSARWKVIGGGLGVTAGFYALAQPFSFRWPDAPGAKDLRIPVAGPWMAIANNGCPSHNPGCSKFPVWIRGILTALDGLGQAGGLVIAFEGMFMTTSSAPPPSAPSQTQPTRSPTRPKSTPTERPQSDPAPRNLFFAPVPMGVGDSGIGFSVSGVF
ncbi:MAG: hypothetical protein FWD57_15000 [Polyangiaceae bacterium]|nr:hypothetical protein [Polyangiaceae bacterium]